MLVLLRYSRGAETQADVMGTQVLYDSGYDPRAMAAFFEKLGAETAGKNPPEFFSDHPNPDHRIERVDEEIDKLGGAPENAERDSAEFERIKKEVEALPVVSKQTAAAGAARTAPAPAAGSVTVAEPSKRMQTLQVGGASVQYPDNWKRYGDKNNVTLAPEGGIVDMGNGQSGVAYGVIASVARIEGAPPANADGLKLATERLIEVRNDRTVQKEGGLPCRKRRVARNAVHQSLSIGVTANNELHPRQPTAPAITPPSLLPTA